MDVWEKIWPELVKGVPAAIVALLVWRVTFKQYQVSKAKFRLDLFDRRYELFSATKSMLDSRSGMLTNQQAINYALASREAQFLFGKDIQDYVLKVLVKRAQFDELIERTTADPSNEKARADRAAADVWFSNEENWVAKRFAPYLSFSEWREERKAVLPLADG